MHGGFIPPLSDSKHHYYAWTIVQDETHVPGFTMAGLSLGSSYFEYAGKSPCRTRRNVFLLYVVKICEEEFMDRQSFVPISAVGR